MVHNLEFVRKSVGTWVGIKNNDKLGIVGVANRHYCEGNIVEGTLGVEGT